MTIGIDYNVPAGTSVAALLEGEVVHIGKDSSFGGWGGLIVIKSSDPHSAPADYLYYAHLKWDIPVKLGQKILSGDIIGQVGDSTENGQWFPHLHLQAVCKDIFNAAAHPEQIDGYMRPPVQPEFFPNPQRLLNGNKVIL